MKALIPQILLLPLLAWFVWSTDIWTAVSLLYPAYFIIALVSCGLLLLPFGFARRPSAIVVPGLWIAFLLVLPFLPNSSLKPLMWGVRDLEPRMDRATVMATLKEAYVGTSHPEPIVFGEERPVHGTGEPSATRILIKPQGRPPELQAEGLLVFFSNGGFTKASFSAD